MNILTKIPEHLRGWFYLGLAVVAGLMLVTVFVVAVINGDDISGWLPMLLVALGLSAGGNTIAQANTSKHKQPPAAPTPDGDGEIIP